MEVRSTRELYTRISLFLPCASGDEFLAFHSIVNYLVGEQGSERLSIKGFTHSDYDPPVFSGFWYHRGKWFTDKNVLLIIDYKFTPGSPEMQNALRRLNEIMVNTYRENNCEQKAFWITTNSISVYSER